jgi:hypothetical protein
MDPTSLTPGKFLKTWTHIHIYIYIYIYIFDDLRASTLKDSMVSQVLGLEIFDCSLYVWIISVLGQLAEYIFSTKYENYHPRSSWTKVQEIWVLHIS